MDDIVLSNDILRAFVPLNSLSDDLLSALAEDQHVNACHTGDELFSGTEFVSRSIYLLSGVLSLIDDLGRTLQLNAGDAASWYPIHLDKKRTYSVEFASDVMLLSFDAERLDSVLTWDQSVALLAHEISADFDGDRAWVQSLLRVKLFCCVPAANIRELFKRFDVQRYRAGDVVIQQGDANANCCYFIREGEADVLIDDAGSNKHIATLTAGRCFGEDALLSGQPRNATIIMATDGVLMRLLNTDFDELLKAPVVSGLSYDNAVAEVGQGAVWLDVRTNDEYDRSHLPHSRHIPMKVLRQRSHQLDQSQNYIVVCDTGRRSAAAAFLLTQAGFHASVLDHGLSSVKVG